MARSGRSRRQSNPSIVLVFAESLNDARALRSLIEALCPSLRDRVREQPRPPSLHRSAGRQPVTRWLDGVSDVVKVVSMRASVACVFIHRDSDGPDLPGRLAASTEAAMRQAGIENGHAVVPVQEIESWWLMFPQATEGFRTAWSGTLPVSQRDVDRTSAPKEELTRRTSRNSRKKGYSEADSPEIARLVASAIESGQAPTGSSRSFDRFRRSVDACCS